MINNFKDIHIGKMILNCIKERNIDATRICSFFKCSLDEIEKMYESENLETDILLKWSKLLEYDFFRIFSQHLIMYSPPSKGLLTEIKRSESSLPKFRKNLYTKEMIDFILEQLNNGTKTNKQIIEEYRIPKTTLHKWINKYLPPKKT
ncbi:transposase [Chryseobacterium aureum]|uniref:transposase n=1 Tax=Chryseobacterium aureum TaxID=2497456 RepID=UPI000F88754E|nr:transposase [Chryseobacterium aureum]